MLGEEKKKQSGVIFGTDGVTLNMGGVSVLPDGCTEVRSGNMALTGHGVRLDMGGMSALSGGGTVMRTGNIWHGPKGSYMLSGTTLMGPGGKMWTGVSEGDVPMLIDHDS